LVSVGNDGLESGRYYTQTYYAATITSVKEEATVPKSFALGQNYPNPFNPSTSIKYQIPVATKVTLNVFDILGREITTLVDGVEEPGYKAVKFIATSLPSGVYFYRLQAGAFTDTKKLLIIR
jgi:hypothetical protein